MGLQIKICMFQKNKLKLRQSNYLQVWNFSYCMTHTHTHSVIPYLYHDCMIHLHPESHNTLPQIQLIHRTKPCSDDIDLEVWEDSQVIHLVLLYWLPQSESHLTRNVGSYEKKWKETLHNLHSAIAFKLVVHFQLCADIVIYTCICSSWDCLGNYDTECLSRAVWTRFP